MSGTIVSARLHSIGTYFWLLSFVEVGGASGEESACVRNVEVVEMVVVVCVRACHLLREKGVRDSRSVMSSVRIACSLVSCNACVHGVLCWIGLKTFYCVVLLATKFPKKLWVCSVL